MQTIPQPDLEAQSNNFFHMGTPVRIVKSDKEIVYCDVHVGMEGVIDSEFTNGGYGIKFERNWNPPIAGRSDVHGVRTLWFSLDQFERVPTATGNAKTTKPKPKA